MSRKMQFFHQLDEKIEETFLADFFRDTLYNVSDMHFGLQQPASNFFL